MGEYIEGRNSPPHYFAPDSIYMITACTYQRARHLTEARTKEYFLEILFKLVHRLQWELEAWVVLDNHYHLIVRVEDGYYRITQLIRPLHSITAKYVNKIDGTVGRKVWQNYWDTVISFESSFLARLQYVHYNPVKHGLVKDPIEYAYSSYRWFMKNALSEVKSRIQDVRFDRVDIRDDF